MINFIELWGIAQIVLFALVGALIGEFYRSTKSKKKESVKEYIAVVCMSSACAFCCGYFLNWLGVKGLANVSAMAISLLGVKYGQDLLKFLLNTIIKRKGV